MKNLFDILGVDDQADDKAIRKAYVEAIKKYPPDKEPGKFQTIREAYLGLRSEETRTERKLFSAPEKLSLWDETHDGEAAFVGPEPWLRILKENKK